MSIDLDPSSRLQKYAHPESLVTGSWLGSMLGVTGLVVLEASSDPQAYNIGHIPGAQRLDWDTELINPVQRNFLSAQDFQSLMQTKGISAEDTVVLYGNQANKWATYAYWIFRYYGFRDVRLLNGGRDAWIREEKGTSWEIPQITPSTYPEVSINTDFYRIFVPELLENYTKYRVIDVRRPEEYSGYHVGTLARRNGHIPGAENIPWDQTLHPNSRFKTFDELSDLFGSKDIDTVIYSNTGKRSAHMWFVMHELLGFEQLRHYDGSWVEWGNMMNMPIENSLDTLEEQLSAVNEQGNQALKNLEDATVLEDTEQTHTQEGQA